VAQGGNEGSEETVPDKGFKVNLDELQRVADEAFPALADVMRTQLPVLNAHEGLHGPGGSLTEVAAFQLAYASYSDEIAARQKHGCEVADVTATAARDIVGLYRRADGQR
jgi:hypothetical protein